MSMILIGRRLTTKQLQCLRAGPCQASDLLEEEEELRTFLLTAADQQQAVLLAMT